MEHVTPAIVTGLLMTLMAVLCLAGLALSAVSLSGTWVVAAATVLGVLLPGERAVGWWQVIVYLAIAALVEGAEAVAGAWGVRRRGGSRMAGLAALGGGLLGMIVGAFVPPPIVGSLAGMLVGSFGLVYLVERQRTPDATHIAWGAVISRVAVMLLKVVVTIGMIAGLAVALFGG